MHFLLMRVKRNLNINKNDSLSLYHDYDKLNVVRRMNKSTVKQNV